LSLVIGHWEERKEEGISNIEQGISNVEGREEGKKGENSKSVGWWGKLRRAVISQFKGDRCRLQVQVGKDSESVGQMAA
jgi:hypothetical protein